MSTDPRLTLIANEPLTAAELDDRLDALLNPVLSSRRTAAPLAQTLAPLERHLQNFVLNWVEVIGRTNYEMAYQFAAAAPDALNQLDLASAEAWVIQAMDAYDREGLYRGSQVFKNFADYAALAGASAHAAAFEEVAHVLELFVCGLAGRRMKVESALQAYTDTETLYLPPRVALRATKEENFLIYKSLVALLWAQSRHGTFNADLDAACAAYTEPARALEWLNYLETLRLEACIARALPGLARDAASLRDIALNGPRYAALESPYTTVHDSIALLAKLPLETEVPRHACMATLRPQEAAAARASRLAREKDELQSMLAALLEEHDKTSDESGKGEQRFSVDVTEAPREDGSLDFELRLDGEPIAPPDNVRNLLDSILQDLGNIPDEYLTVSGNGADYDSKRENKHAGNDPADLWKGVYHEERALFYNEWDHKRRHYRKHWCVLRELDVNPGDAGFVTATLAKYAPQVMQLRRTFEMLRGEDKLEKRMTHGDDIDLDAVIAAYADMRSGLELSERLLVKRRKSERDLAVMFMVDMSGSTKGWINDAEREALVLLTEALEILGDRYAIYGFSGITRKRCEIFRIKRFDEPHGDIVKSRIAGITPQDYTRMGVAIRHLATLLNAVDTRTKLLITLSDGKPDDYSDNYRGEYGVEDTRQALIEAHRTGIKSFCITIDHEARDYLPHMYGAANWTLVDDVSRLPLKVADIYRKLTT